VQAAVGAAPAAPEKAADDVEMGEGAAQETGPLPADVDAEVAETQQTWVSKLPHARQFELTGDDPT
jgi:hypothetical protein